MLQPITPSLYRVGVTVSPGNLVSYFLDLDLFEGGYAEFGEAFLRETIGLGLIDPTFLHQGLGPFAKGDVLLPIQDLVDPSLAEGQQVRLLN